MVGLYACRRSAFSPLVEGVTLRAIRLGKWRHPDLGTVGVCGSPYAIIRAYTLVDADTRHTQGGRAVILLTRGSGP